MDGTAKVSPRYVSISFLCCIMPYWCASMFKLNLVVFAQNSCWLRLFIVFISKTSSYILHCKFAQFYNHVYVENNCLTL